jgi:hypothetical protein
MLLRGFLFRFWLILLFLGVVTIFPAMRHEISAWVPIGYILAGLVVMTIWAVLMKRHDKSVKQVPKAICPEPAPKALCPKCGADTGTSEGQDGFCPNCGWPL